MYPVNDAIERSRIEVVFSLGGGELEDKPRRWAEPRKMAHLRQGRGWVEEYEIRRGWFRWWYPGIPDYAGHDIPWNRSGDFFTVIWDTGSYGDCRPPRRVLLTDGRVARLVKVYRSSGEAECLGGPEDGTECEICEGIHEEGSSDYVYIGEGWIEAVYRVR